jgi:hypothetical protein
VLSASAWKSIGGRTRLSGDVAPGVRHFAEWWLQRVGEGALVGQDASRVNPPRIEFVTFRYLAGFGTKKFYATDEKILIDKRFALHLLLAPFAQELINARRGHAKKEKFCMRER